MKWKIKYYDEEVYKQLMVWPVALRAKYLRIVEMIEEVGPCLGMPYTRAFGKGLFEVRAEAKEGIGRAFFCIEVNQEVIILHSFIKKTQHTPTKELRIALKRLSEVQKNGKTNA